MTKVSAIHQRRHSVWMTGLRGHVTGLVALLLSVFTELSFAQNTPLLVEDVNSVPYTHVGAIGGGNIISGSGSVVYDNWLVLTAAHVVCDATGRLNIGGKFWQRGRQGTDRPESVPLRCAWIFVDNGYAQAIASSAKTAPKALERDIAVAIGYEKMHSSVLPWTFGVSPSQNPSLEKRLVGYAGHHCDNRMYESWATDDVFTDTMTGTPTGWATVSWNSWITQYNLIGATGMSGGPLLIGPLGQETVAAVVVSGRDGFSPICDRDVTIGRPGVRFLTQEVVNILLEPARKAAHAEINSPGAVTWNVGQSNTYQIRVTDDAFINPNNGALARGYHAVDLPAGWTVTNDGRIMGTPQSSGFAEVTVFVWDKHLIDVADPGWLPTVADPRHALKKKVFFTYGQVASCGTQTEFEVRFKRRDIDMNSVDPHQMILHHYATDGGEHILHRLCGEGWDFYFNNPGSSPQWMMFPQSVAATPLPVVNSSYLEWPFPQWDDPETVAVTYAPVFFRGRAWQPSSGGSGYSIQSVFEDQPMVATTITKSEPRKDFIKFVYEGSDLESIEIIGPDVIGVPTIAEVMTWFETGSPPPDNAYPGGGEFNVRIHYADGFTQTSSADFEPNGKLSFETVDGTHLMPPGRTFRTSWWMKPTSYVETGFPSNVTLRATFTDGVRTVTATKELRLVANSTLNPPGRIISVNPAYKYMPASGGQFTVQVTATAGHSWTATSHNSWLTPSGSGTGNGTVTITVAPNTSTSPRTGIVAIGDKQVRIDQGAYYEEPVFAPGGMLASCAQTNHTVAVSALSGISWTAYSQVDWINVTSGNEYQGEGIVYLLVNANTGSQRTGVVSISGRPYTVTQPGCPSSPEIVVEQPVGMSLASGISTVNFGNVSMGQSTDLTFTIRNIGSGSLTGAAPSFLTGNPTDFSLVTAPVFPVPAGGFTTCVVLFTPGAQGLRTTKLSIPNNDSDENPFEITLSGTGTVVAVPEIAVTGNGINIVLNDVTPSTADHTDFGSASTATGTLQRTFTIQNPGGAVLNLTGNPRVVVGGIHAADFTVSTQPGASVEAGGSTAFQVTFNPSAHGLRTATLSLASNDADENPFLFAVQGTGTNTAPTAIFLNPSSIAENNAANATVGTLSAADPDVAETHTFTLVAGGGGTDNGSFTLTGSALKLTPSANFEVKSSYAVRVRVTDSGSNAHEEALTVAVTNVNEPPVFTKGGDQLLAPGTSSPQSVASWATGIDDGDSSVTQALTFNVSTTNNALFAVQPVVAGNGTLTYQPNGTGGSATVSVSITDDGSINGTPALTSTVQTFLITVGSASPEIVVTGNGVSIPLNDVTPSFADHTDFGSVATANGTLVRTYTIQNTGSAVLNLTGNPKVVVGGSHSADFTVTAQPASSVAAAGSTNFQVTFNPSAHGLRTATLNLASNDADENPFLFAIQGTGTNTAPTAIFLNPSSIAENNAASATVGTLSATDPDAAETHTFTLVTGGGSTDNGSFTLTGSTLKLTPSANFEVKSSYALRVRVTDSGSNAHEEALTVAVTNVNEPPVFTKGGDQLLAPGTSSPQSVASWATGIDDGDSSVTQALTFNVSNTNNALFTAQPVVASDGTLTYQPNGTGGSATVSVSITDDSTINGTPALTSTVHTFLISVGSTTPEIVVENSSGTSLTDNTGTQSFYRVTLGGHDTRVFTLRNTGTANLTGIAISRTGSTDFAVVPGVATTLAPNASTTFRVDFTPTTAAVKTATLLITSNDADENPFEINLSGEGGSFILSQTSQVLSPTAVQMTASYISPTVQLGQLQQYFIQFGQTTDYMAPTPCAPFVTPPGGGGLQSLVFAISSLPPASTWYYRFMVQGSFGVYYGPDMSFTLLPDGDISVEQPAGAELADGAASISFGSTLLGSSSTAKVFTLRNTGSQALTNIAITKDGHSADFGLNTAGMSTSLAPGASTIFSVTFTPAASGARSAGLRIVSNDWNENPFDITLTGTGSSSTTVVDAGWNPDAASGSVVSMAVQPDGKVLLGGTFTTLGGVTRNRMARVDAAGAVDPDFNPNVNGEVVAILLQPSGKIVIGGTFSTVGGVARTGLARLNADGTLDSAFNLNADSFVYGLTAQPDGKILVAGGFNDIGGTTMNGVGRLSAEGVLDAEFANPVFNNTVACTVVQPDGRIVVGGVFTTAGGQSRQSLARLNSNGSLDTSFTQSANGWVYAIARQPDGKLVLGGAFTTIGSSTRNRVARLDANGALESAFNPSLNDLAWGIALQGDGKMLVHGNFTTVGGVTRQRLARLHTDGSLDTYPSVALDETVRSAVLQADGQILLGGAFVTVEGQSRRRVARLFNDTAAQQSLTVPQLSRISWSRGGAAPEATEVRFESSSDGATWSALGSGATRVAGGWEQTGLALPVRGMVRARARTASGNFNASSGLVEAVATIYAPAEIAVEQPLGTDLADGAAAVSWGAIIPGQEGSQVFYVRNLGSANLTGLVVTIDGANASDFVVTSALVGPVTGGTQAAFTVRFAPQGTLPGQRSAMLHISSNDVDEASFDIALTGSLQVPATVTRKVLLVDDRAGFGGVASILAADGLDVTELTHERTAGYVHLLDSAYLEQFLMIIYCERGGGSGAVLPTDVAAALEAYIQSGGHLLVTGFDALASPTDTVMAGLVRALSPTSSNTLQGGWQTADISHPVLNGPFGNYRNTSFTATGYNDATFTPNTAQGAVVLATMPSGLARLMFTDVAGAAGSVGFWNGGETGDATAQPDFLDSGPAGRIFRNYVAYATSTATLDFKIRTLAASGVAVVDHNALTGDDRGGIGITTSSVMINGDTNAASYTTSLAGGSSFVRTDGLFSDLRTGRVYTLASSGARFQSGGSMVNQIIELNAATGALTSNVAALSTPLAIQSGCGVFSGHGRLVLYNGSRMYDIRLPSGAVVDLGAMPRPSWRASETWAAWGVAESFGGALYVCYRSGEDHTIRRTRVPDGLTDIVATFTDLNDLATWVAAPRLNRWYFQHEGVSQFGGVDETLGYASATFAHGAPTSPPVITSSLTFSTLAGLQIRHRVDTSPLASTFTATGLPTGLSIDNSGLLSGTVPAAGTYVIPLTATNAAGSTNATLTLAVSPFADDFDPGIDPVVWAAFSSTVAANTTGQGAGAGSTGNSLWFGGDDERHATTVPVDVSRGGYVSFLVALASGTTTTWETVDAGETVVLEYSTDGSTFTQMAGPFSNTTWERVYAAIPAEARTTATQFRFRQLSHSGASSDHWALENVQIGPGVATTRTLTATDRGWYRNNGTHTVSNTNYLTGNGDDSLQYRSFFVFDLPAMPAGEVVTSAQLRLWNPPADGAFAGYLSQDPTENLSIYEVTTAANAYIAGTAGTAGYNDLGNGTVFAGPATVSLASNGSTVQLPMNNAFHSWVASRFGTTISLGGALTTLTRPGTNEYVFGGSGGSSTDTQLVINTINVSTFADIAVLVAGSPLADGTGTQSFGQVNVGGHNDMIVTLRNAGTTVLTGIGVTKTGSAEITLLSTPATMLLPGEESTVRLRFTPGSSGTKTAALQIASNDPDESPFDIALSGIGGNFFTNQHAMPSGASAGVIAGDYYAPFTQPVPVPTYFYAQVGMTLDYELGVVTPSPPLSTGGATSVVAMLPSLPPSTTIYCRLMAIGPSSAVGSDLTFVTASSPSQAYAGAAAAAGLSGAGAAATAMPFNDGVANLLKYAFNMNLGSRDNRTLVAGAGTAGLPVISPSGAGAGMVLRFEFLRRVGSGLVYAPKKSASLSPGSWTAVTGAPTVTPINSTWERVVYEEPAPQPGNARMFGRVEVTLP